MRSFEEDEDDEDEEDDEETDEEGLNLKYCNILPPALMGLGWYSPTFLF